MLNPHHPDCVCGCNDEHSDYSRYYAPYEAALDTPEPESKILVPFGPIYPKLSTTVAKFRKIENPTPEQRQAHGDAVGEAIRALQRSELQRELPSFAFRGASGTWHNNSDGSVGRAVAQQHRSALLSYPDKVRRGRSPETWQAMYEAAMREKRGELPVEEDRFARIERLYG